MGMEVLQSAGGVRLKQALIIAGSNMAFPRDFIQRTIFGKIMSYCNYSREYCIRM
jgi:hypothetical protein